MMIVQRLNVLLSLDSAVDALLQAGLLPVQQAQAIQRAVVSLRPG